MICACCHLEMAHSNGFSMFYLVEFFHIPSRNFYGKRYQQTSRTIQNLWQDKWITTVQSDIKIDTDFQSITQLDIDKRVCSAWLNYKNLKSNLV